MTSVRERKSLPGAKFSWYDENIIIYIIFRRRKAGRHEVECSLPATEGMPNLLNLIRRVGNLPGVGRAG